MQATNLKKINLLNETDARKYFEEYFKQQPMVSGNINDALITFFEGLADNRESALALAAAVIYTAREQQIDPMQVLTEFSKMSNGDLSAYLCVFLNYNRVGTSLLGVNNNPIKNKYVERNIRA
jgi:dimeric dUTPase (all-alpha-NTP-PPase superfamily)